MVTFTQAVRNQNNMTTTTNGMPAFKSSASACVDLFYNIGASRGKDIVPKFKSALSENREYALRIAQHARDIRGGSGERKLFRDILEYLVSNDKEAARALMHKVLEIGRADDLIDINYSDEELKTYAYTLLYKELNAGNALVSKWLPRKGKKAYEIRSFFGWTPKRYRKTLVNLTQVVETKMCAKEFETINFSHVPSVASKRYRKAFAKRAPVQYTEWAAKLAKGDKSVKVNASAIYPYDVIKGWNVWARDNSVVNQQVMEAQWAALPDYIGSASVLPMVDVSGSMSSQIAKSTTTCLEVALSLGLYCADKNKGPFNGTFLTFSSVPELIHLKGSLCQKLQQMNNSSWQMSTNLELAFTRILEVALSNNVSQEEMPQTLLILSDMQFNSAYRRNDNAYTMIKQKYENAGYVLPRIVFWNLNSYDNTPVKFDQDGTALVSGFSPAIMKSVLANDIESYTPENVMIKTIMDSRYDLKL
jgi:Domain of unknown function (DUF2828)